MLIKFIPEILIMYTHENMININYIYIFKNYIPLHLCLKDRPGIDIFKCLIEYCAGTWFHPEMLAFSIAHQTNSVC